MPWSYQDAIAKIVSKALTQFDSLLIQALIPEQENFKLIAENAKIGQGPGLRL